MNQYTQGIMTLLSLVNPVICGLLFSQAVSGKSRASQVAAATRATLTIMVILWLAAIGGAYLLKAFAISLDAFQAAGGLVLAWMGFMMLSGISSPTTTDSRGSDADVSLTPLILFAASPGTITGVITLSVAHAGPKSANKKMMTCKMLFAMLVDDNYHYMDEDERFKEESLKRGRRQWWKLRKL